ncbi:MAG TPA: hypothetical protein VKU39_21940 [Streptosporangiaceae bacterium]|nr:hypothetical protein [Streptosporangiaceae bacterium]
MRTTITLDDDLAIRLEQYRARFGETFKQALNHVLRIGLVQLEQPAAEPEARRTEPLRLGRRVGGSIDNIGEALAVAEGDDYR